MQQCIKSPNIEQLVCYQALGCVVGQTPSLCETYSTINEVAPTAAVLSEAAYSQAWWRCIQEKIC